jgi:hypothetical protein
MKKAAGKARGGAGGVGRFRQSMWLQRSWCWFTKTLIRGARRYEKTKSVVQGEREKREF